MGIASRVQSRGTIANLNGGGAGPEWVLSLGGPLAGNAERNSGVVSPAGSY